MAIFLGVIAFVVVLDQTTKWAIVTSLTKGEIIPVWGSFLSLTSHRNAGAAWGLLNAYPTMLLFVTSGMICAIGYVWWQAIRHRMRGRAWALSFVLGGALGNVLDRFRLGEVVDFVRIVFDFSSLGLDWQYAYPIFNVADMTIVCGVVGMGWVLFMEDRQQNKAQRMAQQGEGV